MDAAVFAEIVFILCCVYALAVPTDKFSRFLGKNLNRSILWIGFLFPLFMMVGSLIYSEIIGYAPCLLCWYGRVMIYPQVVLFGIALWKKDRMILPYITGLTVVALIIALYHTIITITGESPLPCSSNGVSCLTRYVYDFGFISIPFMELSAVVSLFFAIMVSKRYQKTQIWK